MLVVLRADGGPEIGYGHLVRTSSLAEQLVYRGHEVKVATSTPSSAQVVYPEGTDVLELQSRDEVTPFLERIEVFDPDSVITDAYPIDSHYQRCVRDSYPLTVINDEGTTICADVFVNGNVYAPELEYGVLGDPPRWCLGPDFLLLRNKVSEMAAQVAQWRHEPERAIVTMGGSDMEELTPTIVRAFDRIDITVDAIVGPGSSERQEHQIRRAAKNVTAEVRVTRDPDDLPSRMFDADFGVCTASTTTYELLALATPIICTPVADNQEPIAAALRDRNLATVVYGESTVNAWRTAIREYVENPTARDDRRKRGLELVDGCGAHRVCEEVLSLMEEKNGT